MAEAYRGALTPNCSVLQIPEGLLKAYLRVIPALKTSAAPAQIFPENILQPKGFVI